MLILIPTLPQDFGCFLCTYHPKWTSGRWVRTLFRPHPWLASPQPVSVTFISSFLSYHFWTLLSCWFIPDTNLCLCLVPHLEPSVLSKCDFHILTRCTAPPPGSSPVTDSRGDPSFLYQGPHLKWDGVAKEHISLSTQGSLFFCSNEMRPLLCGSWRRRRSNQWPELPVWGQQSLRKSREKGSDEPVLPSLLLPLWTPSYASLSSRNTQAEVVTFPSSSMIFCNHNCFPNCI